MKPSHVAIIGFGSIARDLIGILRDQPDGRPQRLSLLVRKDKAEAVHETASALAGADCGVLVTSELDQILADAPDVVVECASHMAVAAYGHSILSHGTDLIVASVGALADPDLKMQLVEAARASGAQVTVPAGAVGGIDALGAARLSGLTSVTYTGRKPPGAWAGTPAETVTDLAALSEEYVIFEGSAREAALSYPKNANVAATLALAGMGMDATRVRLVADPATRFNVHEFEVESSALNFSVRLTGKPSPDNPKTSRSTVFSIAHAVLNRYDAIVI